MRRIWHGRQMGASMASLACPCRCRRADYLSKGHEYFDVWAPEMATHYGEVFWTNQGTTKLPDAIVKRFAGKVMAITGYEQDQVIVTPLGQPGVNPQQDASVPINWARQILLPLRRLLPSTWFLDRRSLPKSSAPKEERA